MHILVVDDHRLFRAGVSLLLSNIYAGVHVSEAEDIEAALDRLDADGAFDIVLLDLAMPGMEDLRGLSQLRERIPDIPIVMLSAVEEGDKVTQAIQMGARGYILKSASEQVLQHAISLALSGETYIPAGVFMDSDGRLFSSSAYGGSEDNMSSPLDALTGRQREVLSCMMRGASNKEIARDLGLLESTVKAHVKAVLKKLGAANRTQASMIGSQHGLVARADQGGPH